MKFSRTALKLAALMLLYPSVAAASGTRLWELAGFEELLKGELKGTVLSSVGDVQLGLTADKGELPEGIGAVWSAARKGKELYIGTGYDGKIFRIANRKAVHVADTGQLVVTAMAFDKQGDLYIAALPDPVILRIPSPKRIIAGKPVTAEKWATLPEDSEHVWTLSFSKDGRTLFAGTGPEGKIFAIGKDAKPKLYLDTEEEHILSTALDDEGRLLAGTSPSAVIFRVDGPGRSTALADFDDAEVKALSVHDGYIYAAVNDFKTPPAVPSKTAVSTTGSDTSKSTSKTAKTVVGDGSLYRIDADGRQEQLWSEKKEHIVSMAVASTGTVFLGLGVEGKVISVNAKREARHELDLEERQVMVLEANRNLTFAGCGDSGAIYDVGPARAAEATYLTPLLDAETVSEWGRVTWFADGKLKIQSRSGNTETPNTAWSDWSKPLSQKELVPSPPGRYLQFRLSWAQDDKAIFTSLQTAMKSANQRALITEFDSGSQFPKPSGSVDETISDRIADAKPDPKIDPELSLSWKVKNPDGDDMRYRLWYRKTARSAVSRRTAFPTSERWSSRRTTARGRR